MRNHGFRGARRDSRQGWNAGPSGIGPSGFGRYGRPRRRGLISGGFYWLAGWLGLPTWVVLAFFVVLFLTIGWPALIIYLACALLLRPEEPQYAAPATSEAPGVRLDLDREARDVRDRTRDIEARIGRLESHVTSKEFDFDRRLGEAGGGGGERL
jgi:phage shock protein C